MEDGKCCFDALRLPFRVWRLAPIDFPAAADFHHEDYEDGVLNLIQARIADAGEIFFRLRLNGYRVGHPASLSLPPMAQALFEVAPGGPPAGVDTRAASDSADEEGGHETKRLSDGPADGPADIDAYEDEKFHRRIGSMNEAAWSGGAGYFRILTARTRPSVTNS